MGRVKKVSCALCGKVVWVLPTDEDMPTQHEGADKWNAPKFLKNVVAAGSSTPVGVGVSPTPGRFNKRAIVRPISPPPPTSLQTVIPVFRIITSSSSAASNTHSPAAPGPPTTPQYLQRSMPYPLCVNGWCKERLRTTVELWKFLRERVVERIWEDETRSEMIIAHQLSQEQRDGVDAPVPPPKVNTSIAAGSTPPPIPPRKKLAGLWGAISGSASPASGISPTASPDTPSGNSVASRGINIGGLTSGLGGFLRRKNSMTNGKLGSSREPSPTRGLPALPRNTKSATSPSDDGVAKAQDTEKSGEKEPPVLGAPVEEKADVEKIEQKVQTEEEMPPLVKQVQEDKYQPPSGGPAPLTHGSPGGTDVLSSGKCSTPESVVVPPAGALAKRLDEEFETEAIDKSTCNLLDHLVPLCWHAHWFSDPKPVEVSERPKTPETSSETKINLNEQVPEASVHAEDPRSTPAPSTPARNPARVLPFGGNDTPKADGPCPSTPATTVGVPPPVPRRAAARGTPRPNSMLVTPDIFKPPPPRSERKAVEKVEGDEKEQKEEEKKEEILDEKKEAEIKTEVDEVATAVAEKTEEATGIAPVTAEETKEEPKVGGEVLTPGPASQESLGISEAAADTATPNTPIGSPSPLPESTLEPATEAPSTTFVTETPPADRASVLSASSASVYTKDTKDMLLPIPATVATDENSPNNDEWVGNAQWEDRMWTEIVRIREEMFWARVGSGTVGGTAVD